jgi:predicted O-linked N-acetylglucosamine transferase (SPINDLY family)
VELQPRNASVLNNWGVNLASQGRNEEAVTAFREALALSPQDPDLLNNLGAALSNQAKLDEAVLCYEEALRLRPDFAEAHHNLGNVMRDLCKLDEALAAYENALRAAPHFAPAYYGMGQALELCGKLDQALAAYRRAVEIRPDYFDAHASLGDALLAKNRAAEALAVLQEAQRIRPDSAEAYNGLGNAYCALERLDEAVSCYQSALHIRPEFSAPRHNLALALQAQGKLGEALDCHREAMRLDPEDPVVHSSYAGSLNYDPRLDASTLLAEHRRWAEKHAPIHPTSAFPENPAEPNRRLRVGYLSPDFRSHAVAYFLEPILAHHDPDSVESFGYADVASPDWKTTELRTQAQHWRDTFGLSDDHVFGLIRQDRIDILVDLAGHTAKNRLLVFARRPAPVQLSYLGYPCTTGLAAIDYRLGDMITDPAGEPPAYTEELIRLPGCFCCYAPPRYAPGVGPPPAVRRGSVMFGSLHKLEKLNDAVLALWCRILKEIPSAQLLLARDALQGKTAADFLHQFEHHDVDPGRLSLRRVEPVNLQHLRLYEEIDISLDPFPWNGHTTACESLWMGVPVITLRGQRHSGRMVASVLTSIGLTDLIADTAEAYVGLAVRLAGDIPKLIGLRSRLRSQMMGSPLCDGATFTRGLEEAYRRMWQSWCQRRTFLAGTC